MTIKKFCCSTFIYC